MERENRVLYDREHEVNDKFLDWATFLEDGQKAPLLEV